VHDAVKHIQQRAGSQFDPACVEAFIAAMPRILEIKLSGVGDPVPADLNETPGDAAEAA